MTRVPLGDGFFIPDAIFGVQAPDGSRFLYALEVYNGIDTGRVHRQLQKHALALGEGHISELYRYEHAHRVLCVFETDSALQAAEKRLCADPDFTEPLKGQFAFSTLAALRENFLTGWRFLVPGRTCIFDAHLRPAAAADSTGPAALPPAGQGSPPLQSAPAFSLL